MNDAKERVQVELDNLVQNITKLMAFTFTEKYTKLSKRMQELLKDQLFTMMSYAQCLRDRLNIWDMTNEEIDKMYTIQ